MGEVSALEMKQMRFKTLAYANISGLIFFGGLVVAWLLPRQMPMRGAFLILWFLAGVSIGLFAAIRGPLRLLGVWFLLLNLVVVMTIISGVTRANH